jgi:hypothetical protein
MNHFLLFRNGRVKWCRDDGFFMVIELEYGGYGQVDLPCQAI